MQNIQLSLRWVGVLLFLAVAPCLFAARGDTLFTNYSKGTYHTCAVRYVDAQMAPTDSLVDLLIYQFRNDIEPIFDWAFKGLGNSQSDKERREVQLYFRRFAFDEKTSVGTFWADIVVPGVKTFKDVEVKSRILKNVVPDKQITTTMEIFYSNSILKDAHGTLRIVKVDNQLAVRIDTFVTFGWFFNIFITQRRYRNLLEWRVAGFVDNLSEAFNMASR
ncbi:MAG: hypothetical protein Q4D14_01755 [Bacteroidales bacterium]|nr:hypothetical protein [Bacteroidales bacterium]